MSHTIAAIVGADIKLWLNAKENPFMQASSIQLVSVV